MAKTSVRHPNKAQTASTLSSEFLGGIVAAALLAMLPMTRFAYILLSILLAVIVAHIGWRVAGMVTGSTLWRSFWAVASIVVLVVVVAWGFQIRFAHAGTAAPPMKSPPSQGKVEERGSHTGNNCIGPNAHCPTTIYNPPLPPQSHHRRTASSTQKPVGTPPPQQAGGDIEIQGPNTGIACTNGAQCTQETPPHNLLGIYQGDAEIGTVKQPVISADHQNVEFQIARFTDYPDPSQPLEFQGMTISCPSIPHPDTTIAAEVHLDFPTGLTCSVVDTK